MVQTQQPSASKITTTGGRKKHKDAAAAAADGAAGLTGSSSARHHHHAAHLMRGNPFQQLRDQRATTAVKDPRFGEGAFESKASTQRERARIVLLSNLTAVINPECAEENAFLLDEHIEVWTSVLLKDRKATGECPFCNVCVVGSEWLRTGFGNPDFKPKKARAAAAAGTAAASASTRVPRSAAGFGVKGAATKVAAATGTSAAAPKSKTSELVAPCRGCRKQLDIDIAPLQVFYADPTTIMKRKSSTYSATNVKRSRAKIRKELTTAGKAMSRMVKALRSVMDVDADEEEATARAEEAERRLMADARLRRGKETVESYHQRISAVPGMLQMALMQGNQETKNSFVERLHGNGLLEMATGRKEGETDDAYAARLHTSGLFSLVTERWHGETDSMYVDRIEKCGLLVAAFASRSNEQPKDHAARLQASGVLTELLFRVQGKGEGEFSSWLDQLGLQAVWENYTEKMSKNTAVRNTLDKFVSRLQDHTLGRPEAAGAGALPPPAGPAGQSEPHAQTAASSKPPRQKSMLWARAKKSALHHIRQEHIVELQQLEKQFLGQVLKVMKKPRDSVADTSPEGLTTVDEDTEQHDGSDAGAAAAAAAAAAAVDSTDARAGVGVAGAASMTNHIGDGEAEREGGDSESVSSEEDDPVNGGGDGGMRGDAATSSKGRAYVRDSLIESNPEPEPEPDTAEAAKRRRLKRMPGGGLSQSELQAMEVAEAQADQEMKDAMRAYSIKSRNSSGGNMELEMYKRDMEALAAAEAEEEEEALAAAAGPSDSVLGYMAEVVSINETTKHRYTRVFESVASASWKSGKPFQPRICTRTRMGCPSPPPFDSEWGTKHHPSATSREQ